MNRQQGQAMAEFAVVAGLFVSLLLGTELLFRYLEIQRHAVQAAREAAFSGSWLHQRLTTDVLQKRIRAWHFEQPGWMDPTGNEAMPSAEEAVALRAAQEAPPGLAPQAVSVALRPLASVGGFLGAAFDLPMDRLSSATIDVSIAPVNRLPESLGELHVELSERLAVLGDTWAASGPAEVAERTGGLVPTAMLRSHAAWLKPLLVPLSLIEPAVSRLCLGLIEPDRVPVDRLGGGVLGMFQTGVPGCR
jgi:hypothetical protein